MIVQTELRICPTKSVYMSHFTLSTAWLRWTIRTRAVLNFFSENDLLDSPAANTIELNAPTDLHSIDILQYTMLLASLRIKQFI